VSEPHARITQGRLGGDVGPLGIARFRGIPFAAPPVGLLRWRPPAPPSGWDGVRRADRFGPAPLQGHPPRRSLMYRANFDEPVPPPMSEDCLYLNVWTPDHSPDARLPVMVWLHGGGNRYGHGSQRIHDGEGLARHGLVVVTLNYRLGALGFLAHPALATVHPMGASGNYALLDVVAALHWVQENIGGLGGDPGRVTLAGNSAGAALITHLMATPRTAGLFGAAIGQSSAGIFRAEGDMPDQEAAQRQGVEFTQPWGHDIETLRDIPAVDLATAGHFPVVVDGALLTRQTEDVYMRGAQHRIPLLVGRNADEGVLYARPAHVDIVRRLPETAPGLADCYPASDAEQARASARRFVADTRFDYPVWRWALTHAEHGHPTYLYRFDRTPPLPDQLARLPAPDGAPGSGSFHTAELPYMSGNLRMLKWPWTDGDRALSAAMVEAWAAFVSSGEPNTRAGPAWPQFGAAHGCEMRFGDALEPRPVSDAETMRRLDRAARPVR